MPVPLFAAPRKGNRYSRSRGGSGGRSGSGRSAGRALARLLGSALAWGLTLLVGLGFFVLLSVGLLAAYRWSTTTGFFAIRGIEVTGNHRLSEGEVLAEAEVAPGQNCLGVKMDELKARLLGNPWVEAVSIRRVLPDSLVIHVTERAPLFWVRREGGLFYADRTGRIIAPVEPGKFVSLPQLVLGEDSDHLLARLSVLMGDLKRADLPFDPEASAWIRLSPQAGVEFYQEQGGGRRVSVGVEEWSRNLARLRAVWEDLARRGELDGIASIRAHGATVWVYRGRAQGHGA
jgi:cell division protein FtsQ